MCNQELINQEVINTRGEEGKIVDIDDEGFISVAFESRVAKYAPYVIEKGVLKLKDTDLNARVKMESACKHMDEHRGEIQDSLDKLNKLTGLAKIKTQIHDLVSEVSINALRSGYGLKTPAPTRHMVFIGNSGTGKTTVARIVAEIYRHLGILTRGQFVEVDRSGLVAAYSGQTALKTKDVVKSAIGGVLFIDEAYAIMRSENDDFGYEALDTLTKEVEDHRDNLVVILAGYKDEMNKFIHSNPGLCSRFRTVVDFDDYSKDELFDIYTKMLKDNDYFLSELAEKECKEYFAHVSSIDGNARGVRNLFEETMRLQARRLYELPSLTKDNLITINDVDLPFHVANDSSDDVAKC